jgi:DNA-binding SARP family transcriptional activator/tetratricopeptide (TPR) repeat protein
LRLLIRVDEGTFEARRSHRVPAARDFPYRSGRRSDTVSAMGATKVRARLLGSFELAVDGRPIQRTAFERPSGLRLLKLLFAIPDHRVRRESAAELLWPEADPDRSGANLRKAIHFARRAVAGRGDGGPGEELVTGDGEWLTLGQVDLDVDIDRLGSALRLVERAQGATDRDPGLGDALEALARLGGEDLLPEDPYDEWLIPLRERLRQRTSAGLVAGASLARGLGDRGLALALVERALAMDGADEGAHEVAIELHLDDDHVHAARRQLQACELAMAEAYGVEPSPKLRTMIEAAASRRATAGTRIEIEAPIVGRRLELEAVDVALDRVAAGRSASVLLHGTAGIGKTRVFRELVHQAQASSWRVVEARGVEAAPDTAFAELGRALMGALGGQAPGDLAEPARSALLTVAPDPSARPALTFASDAALIEGLLGVVVGLAAAGPTVVAIDDIQWLDGPSLNLLARAVQAVRDLPLLLLLTLRTEPALLGGEVGQLVDDVRRVGGLDVAVGPLGPREIRVLVERELAGERLDEDLASAIARQSAGAPLFALELFRSAREAGNIEAHDGRWGLGPGAGELAVPRSVARLVDGRVARLEPAARSILATAAELGDEVTFEGLTAATGAPAGDILDALDLAIESGIVVEAHDRYRFGHPLFRAALRHGLAARARGDLHLQIAMALAHGVDPLDRAAIDAAGPAVDLVAIAAHAAEAVDLGRAEAIPLAVGAGLAAGARQARLFDFEAATQTLERALAIWFRLTPAERKRYPAGAGRMELGWARHGAGDETAAADAFRAAAVLARDDAERARAYAAEAWMPYQHGRFDRADEILRAGLQHVFEPVAVATLESDRGWILGRLDRTAEGLPMLERAVAVLEGAAAPDVVARALDRYAVALSDGSDPQLGVPILERALHLSIDVADTRLEATIRMHLAGCLRDLGDLDAAMAQLDRSIELTRHSGDRYIEAVSEWNAATVEQRRGRFAEGISRRRRELAILGEIGGNPQNEAMAHAHVAYLARRQGDEQLAVAEEMAARNLARHSGIGGLPERLERVLTTEWFGP